MDGREIVKWQQAGPRSDPRPARAGLHRAADPGHAPQRPVRRCRSPTSTSAGAPARAAHRRWRWPPKCGPCSKAATTSASRTSAACYLPALRHRVILNFEAQAEGIDTDQVLLDILEKLPRRRKRPRRRDSLEYRHGRRLPKETSRLARDAHEGTAFSQAVIFLLPALVGIRIALFLWLISVFR